MLEMTRKAAAALPRALPRYWIETLAAAGTVSTFSWLLAHDLVQPIAVYLLEIFLVF
jgi:hypothetical protein